MSTRATAAQLANRKIKDASSRRRPGLTTSTNKSIGSAPSSQQNPFAGININPNPAINGSQQAQPTNGFGFNPIANPALGAQSSSFPPDQPSSSTSTFNFTSSASSSFPAFGASVTNPFSAQTPSLFTGASTEQKPASSFQGSVFSFGGQTAPQNQQTPTPTFSFGAAKKPDTSDLSMEDDSALNTSGSPMKGFTFSGQGSTSTPNAESLKRAGEKDEQAKTGQNSMGGFGNSASFAGFGKTDAKSTGDQPAQNIFSQSVSAPTSNGLSFGQSVPESSKPASSVFTNSTNQSQGIGGFSTSNTDQARTAQNIFGASSASTAPPPPAFSFPGPDSKQTSDKQTSKAQSERDLQPQNQGNNIFSALSTPSSENPLFSNIDKTGPGSLSRENKPPLDDQKANSSTPELSNAFNTSAGQSNTSKLFGQKLSEVKNTSGTLATSEPSDNSKGFSSLFSQPTTSTLGSFSIPPSSQTATLKFSANSTSSTSKGDSLEAAQRNQNVQDDDPFTDHKYSNTGSSLPTTKSASSLSFGASRAPFLGQDQTRSVEPATTASSTNLATTNPKTISASNMFPTPGDTGQAVTDADTGEGMAPQPNDSLQNQSVQKITFSSRGPSHVPSYINNDTRAEVDVGHRLRSLNEGLLDFLSKLDPTSFDFGRAIEYYCDLRQALGQPLKFHQRAAAGEKRKGAESQHEDEPERAAKRQRGPAGQVVTPTKSSSSTQTEGSPASTTPRAPPPDEPAIGGPDGRSSSTSSILRNLMSPPEKTPRESQPFASSSIFNQQSNSSASTTSSKKTGFTFPTPQASIFNTPTSLHGQINGRDPGSSTAGKLSKKRTSDDYESDEEDDAETAQELRNEDRSKRRRPHNDPTRTSSNGAVQFPVEKGSTIHISNSGSSNGEDQNVSDDEADGRSDSDSDQADDETGDPSYEPIGDVDGEPEESDDSESEEEEDAGSSSKYEFGKGPSLFDRVTYPNGSSQQPIAEDPKETTTNSTNESKQGNAFGKTGFGSTNGSGGFSQNPSKSIFGTSDNNHSRLSGTFSSAPGKENGSSEPAEKKAKPSLFKTTPLTGFGSTTSPALSKSLSNGSIFGSGSVTPNQTPNNSTGSFGSSFGKDIPGSGLFGSRPATPTPGADDKPQPSGTSLSANNESPRVDHTFKHDSPIKFAASSSEPAPSFTFTAASPSQPEKRDVPSASPVKPLSTLFGESSGNSSLVNQTQKPSTLGFAFGSHLKPDNALGILSSDVSSVTSANSSRATSPGVTDTDEGTDGAEDGNDEQLPSLMTARPGEEDEDVLYEALKAKAFKMDKNGGWKSVALGSFRVLKPKGYGKTRMLLRADPGAHIILNAFLVPFVDYKALAPTPNSKIGAVQFIVPLADGKPENWLIKMKGVELAQELASVLEANKQ